MTPTLTDAWEALRLLHAGRMETEDEYNPLAGNGGGAMVQVARVGRFNWSLNRATKLRMEADGTKIEDIIKEDLQNFITIGAYRHDRKAAVDQVFNLLSLIGFTENDRVEFKLQFGDRLEGGE